MRGDVNFQNQAALSLNRPVHLAKVELGCSLAGYGSEFLCTQAGGEWTDPIYMTDWDRDIEWGGDLFKAVGHYMGLGEISESASFQVSTTRMTLGGIDQVWVSI